VYHRSGGGNRGVEGGGTVKEGHRSDVGSIEVSGERLAGGGWDKGLAQPQQQPKTKLDNA